ncbi:MAG: AraC family transcriptional regulator, partial [Ktedonobacteraceae bacterium]|nr:AraC family transcriptional regulator [Ktedonobacteraceae bacterium]
EQTGLSVGVVAERCGFQSRYHFSRRIRQAVGYTPLEVRQRSWQRR